MYMYKAFFTQTHLLHAQNVCAHKPKHVHSTCKTCVYKDLNAFAPCVKHVYLVLAFDWYCVYIYIYIYIHMYILSHVERLYACEYMYIHIYICVHCIYMYICLLLPS